ncbi:MAG: hypothetical protein AVO33_10210 [delta proteobacterium ML8_F1]|nr:MAG: hypothetical protein AVO33_10210 [delta proteobacterium ML8_F1]
METRIYKDRDFRTSQWSGGTTRELFIYPEWSAYPDRDFLLRISTATVALETTTFTRLEGFRRWITPLEGELVLQGDGGTDRDLKPYEIHAFDGGESIESHGKVTDFNLMVKKGWEAQMKVLKPRVNETLTLDVGESDLVALYLPRGGPLGLKGTAGETLKAGELLIAEGSGSFSILGTAWSEVICCRINKARSSDQ